MVLLLPSPAHDQSNRWIHHAISCTSPYSVLITSSEDLQRLWKHQESLECLTRIAFAAQHLNIAIEDLACFTRLESLEFWFSLEPYPRLEKLPILHKPAQVLQICKTPPGLDTLAFYTPGMLQFAHILVLSSIHLMHVRFATMHKTLTLRLHHLSNLQDMEWTDSHVNVLSLVDLPKLRHIYSDTPISVRQHLTLDNLDAFDYDCCFQMSHGHVTIKASKPIHNYSFLRSCQHCTLDLSVPLFEPSEGLEGFEWIILRNNWVDYDTPNKHIRGTVLFY